MRTTTLLALMLGLAACSAPSPSTPATPTEAPTAVEAPTETKALSPGAAARKAEQAYWVERTDAELDAAFEETCEAAKADGKPVLISFSADWCPDCKRMYALSKEGVLHDELEGWHTVVVDPGRFDRHQAVLAAFDVDRIVTWVATKPQDCRLPAPSWTRLRQGVFEPQTGEPWTAEQLAGWLREAREG